MSGTPRASRGNSRYNSPFPSTQNNSTGASGNKSADASDAQQTLDRWMEPSLAQPRPSFAEAGNARQGVVKGMEPLGSLPSAKARKAALKTDLVDAGGIGTKSGPSSASTPNERAESVNTLDRTLGATSSTSLEDSTLFLDEVDSRALSVISKEPGSSRPSSVVPAVDFSSRRSSVTSVPTIRAHSAAPVPAMEVQFSPATDPTSQTPPVVSASDMSILSSSAVPGSGVPARVVTPAQSAAIRAAEIAMLEEFFGVKSSASRRPASQPPQLAPSVAPLAVQIEGSQFPFMAPVPEIISRASSSTPMAAELDSMFDSITNPESEPSLPSPSHFAPPRLPSVPPMGLDLTQPESAAPLANKPTPSVEIPESPQPVPHYSGSYTPSGPLTPQLQNSQVPRTNNPYATPVVSRPSTAPQPYAAMPSGQSVFPAKPLGDSPPIRQLPTFQPLQMFPNGEYLANQDTTDRVVESAVQQALDEQHYPTAYALRTLYDEQRMNPRMVRLIDDIFNERADEDQITTFTNVIKFRKKEGKKDRTGEYYFNGDGSDPAPDLPFSLSNKSPRSTPGLPGAGARRGSDAERRPSLGFSPISPTADIDQHISKKHKGNDFGSTSKLEMNGDDDDDDAPSDLMDFEPSAPAENGVENGAEDLAVKAVEEAEELLEGGAEMERSMSQSSSSSLSSVDEALVAQGSLSTTASPAHKAKAAASSHANAHAAANTQKSPRFAPNANSLSAESHPSAGNQSRPIIALKKPGPKMGIFTVGKTGASASNTPSSSATGKLSSSAKKSAAAAAKQQRKESAAQNSAILSATLSSNQSVPAPSKSRAKKDKEVTPNVVNSTYDEQADEKSRLKRNVRNRARENAGPVVESFERSEPSVPEPVYGSDAGNSVTTGPTKGLKNRVRLTNKRGTRQSQVNDESELSSPTLFSFPHDLAPVSVAGSRAGTPSGLNRPTRRGKTGGGLRVKTSPMKKRAGTAAGIPRASGERSPTNGGFPNNQDENDDYCSSCGGNGQLVCCDGCTRAFHSQCFDPPIYDDSSSAEWFCNICQTRNLPRGQAEGPFGQMLANLERKNPSAFHLPKDIREYFENVKTGLEGEYEEVSIIKPKNTKGYEEAIDHFKLRDAKGKAILCHSCHEMASAPSRSIIPCTYCGLHWHLDCLDPPLAKEPPPGRSWRCPAHVDDLLTTIPNLLAPAHRFRKIKGMSAIKPAVSRGLKNNGHIEVEFDPSDNEEEPGFYEQREYGQIYKLPEQGIKLDFISQIKRKQGGVHAPEASTRSWKRRKTAPFANWSARSIDEQQAALNLASLQVPQAEHSVSTSTLVKALWAGASPAVLDLMSKDVASSIDPTYLGHLKSIIDGAITKQQVDKVEDTPALSAPAAEGKGNFETVSDQETAKPAETGSAQADTDISG